MEFHPSFNVFFFSTQFSVLLPLSHCLLLLSLPFISNGLMPPSCHSCYSINIRILVQFDLFHPSFYLSLYFAPSFLYYSLTFTLSHCLLLLSPFLFIWSHAIFIVFYQCLDSSAVWPVYSFSLALISVSFISINWPVSLSHSPCLTLPAPSLSLSFRMDIHHHRILITLRFWCTLFSI